jgi:hypothetical protein
MRKVFLIPVFLILAAFTVQVECKEYYVDSIADTVNGDGSIEHPWSTITQAINSVKGFANDPAVIHITSGLYNKANGEIFPIALSSYIMLVGEERGQTILDATGFFNASVITCINVDGVFIENLELTNGTGTLCQSG